MRAPISVVLATMNAERSLPLQLAALGEGLREGLIRELIVVDAGSEDTTRSIASQAGAEILDGPHDRAAALRQGAAAASGEWLMFGPADTVLCEGWSAQVYRHLEKTPELAGALSAQMIEPVGWKFLRRVRRWLLVPHGLYTVASVDGRMGLEQQLKGRMVRR